MAAPAHHTKPSLRPLDDKTATKPIELPDEALTPHMGPAEMASFRASGVTLKSVTVLGTKPA